MMKSELELIHPYAEKKRNGMSYSDIRKELVAQALDKEAINTLIKSIDDYILESDRGTVVNSLVKEYKYLGYSLIVIGIAVLSISYYYAYRSGILLIPVGMFIAGCTILYYTRGKHIRTNTNMYQERRSKFRHRN